ncbi:Six-hairpin glycosidase [Peniophora sp. CONT]|nr:Six-hairpin glycosidase [Peniophora sp. CONT]
MHALACALLVGAWRVLAAPAVLTEKLVSEILDESTRVNITLVRNQAVSASTQSWEVGTLAEALLELEWPALSVYGAGTADVHPPLIGEGNTTASDVFTLATNTLASKPADSLALVANDGAVGDPASIGPAVLLANWTLSNATYGAAAQAQRDYLLNYAPRTDGGAISQRTDQVQLWSDFVYMAPPFLAYYGALQNDYSLVKEAYNQCWLYRDALRDVNTGLWRHVALGDWQDNNLWATGNGWAAAGIMRVLKTINGSSVADALIGEQADMAGWVDEILSGAWAHQQANGTLLNYIDQTEENSWADTSATALLAATSFRHAVFTNSTTHIDAANLAYGLVENSIDENGALHGTINPLTFVEPTADGQTLLPLSFVSMTVQTFKWRSGGSRQSCFAFLFELREGAKLDVSRLPSAVPGKREAVRVKRSVNLTVAFNGSSQLRLNTERCGPIFARETWVCLRHEDRGTYRILRWLSERKAWRRKQKGRDHRRERCDVRLLRNLGNSRGSLSRLCGESWSVERKSSALHHPLVPPSSYIPPSIMLPAQRKKVDISSMTEEEKKLFRLYGKLPTHKNVLTKMQKDRKYFDSGDYALSKAGVAPQNAVGTSIPTPENIPHATSPPAHGLSISPSGTPNAPHAHHRDSNASTSPVRESHLAHSSQVPESEAPVEMAAVEVAAPAPVAAAEAPKAEELMATEE